MSFKISISYLRFCWQIVMTCKSCLRPYWRPLISTPSRPWSRSPWSPPHFRQYQKYRDLARFHQYFPYFRWHVLSTVLMRQLKSKDLKNTQMQFNRDSFLFQTIHNGWFARLETKMCQFGLLDFWIF